MIVVRLFVQALCILVVIQPAFAQGRTNSWDDPRISTTLIDSIISIVPNPRRLSRKQKTALEQYKRKLLSAIHSNWKPPKDGGIVQVSFTLSATGQMSKIRFERCSGVSICDDAAIQAIEGMSPPPCLIPGVKTMRISVTFDSGRF